MQIALTKKLAEAMEIKPSSVHKIINPLFTWTANWTKAWDNSRTEDMLVLVNNATRFTVSIYQVKRKDMKKVGAEMMIAAIKNTLLIFNLNNEIIDEYLRVSGEVEFIVNRDRQFTAWVNKAGTECAFHIGYIYSGAEKIFSDTIGAAVNSFPVGYTNSRDDGFVPYKKMFDALAALTGKPVYKYRAFELLVTLDLEIYQATRRIIVPANIELPQLHSVLQRVFHWEDRHLHDWKAYEGRKREPAARLVMTDEDLAYDDKAILEEEHKLSEFLPKYKRLIYTYDMGDNWEHIIELVRIIDEYNRESPYLLEAVGQAPPEDVGGVGGYIDFRNIMLDPKHEDHEQMKQWSGFWHLELTEWERCPRVIHDW
ncbi:MAG: plasmid pRiA4b ORF-3 family protein [Eubacteriales bacterium]|nr:plasmid pRiA4b ORF-3 family protein [Eubacteriales bacterium]